MQYRFWITIISNAEDTGLSWWQAGSTAVEIVDWHPKEGNPTAKAMTIWISPTSDAWSGGGLGGLNINVSAYNKISVLVYKNVAGTVWFELQDNWSKSICYRQLYNTGCMAKIRICNSCRNGQYHYTSDCSFYRL